MVCFSVVSPGSFNSIRKKWLPEIRHSIAGSKCASHKQCNSMPPFILIGTQCDLRHDVKVLIELNALGEQPIATEYARSMANKMGAICYIECSALTQKNLKVHFVWQNTTRSRFTSCSFHTCTQHYCPPLPSCILTLSINPFLLPPHFISIRIVSRQLKSILSRK